MKFNLRNISILLTIFLGSFSVYGAQFEYHNSSYKDAKKSASFVRFDMSSTKLGIITTSFTGFVKNFKLSGELNQGVISKASIEFMVRDLDTDIDGRNEKMWDHCLGVRDNPIVRIKLLKDVGVSRDPVDLPAIILIRGVEKEITLRVKSEQSNAGELILDLSGELSLKALEIPDPSIAIASVKDGIKIQGHFIVKQ